MTSNSSVFELHCRAERKALCWVREVVVQTAGALGFSGDDLNKIELSVDEACANVMDHAYPEPPDIELPLVVRFETSEDHLTITVMDRGVGGPAGEKHQGVEDIGEYLKVRRFRGLGTYIMQQFMDKVEFQQSPDSGTSVSMIKYREASGSNIGEG
jgi:serine/threonine-protein kinase RsbW